MHTEEELREANEREKRRMEDAFIRWLNDENISVMSAAEFCRAMDNLAEQEGKRFAIQMRPAENGPDVPVMTLFKDPAHSSWIEMAPYISAVDFGTAPYLAARDAEAAFEKEEESDAQTNPRLLQVPDTFAEALPHLSLRLLGYEANKDGFLSGALFVRKLDLALVPFLEKDGWMMPALPKEIAGRWKMDPEEIVRESLRKTKEKYPIMLTPIKDVLQKMGYPGADTPLYVLTAGGVPESEEDDGFPFGAVACVMPDVLRAAADRIGSDFYVFPSSQTEVLLCPIPDGSNPYDPDTLRRMVRDINQSLPSESVLTNSVYIYRRGEDLALL